MGNRIYGCDDCLAVCPWNKFAQAGPRGEARGARSVAGAAARRAGAARRCELPRAVHEIAGQAHRPRPLRPQCADRDRQLRRRRARGRSRAAARRCIAAGARRGGVGARPARSGAARRHARQSRHAKPIPPCARNGRPRSQARRPDADAALPRARLLRALLRRRIRRALRPHHRHIADAEARRPGRDAGVRRGRAVGRGARRRRGGDASPDLRRPDRSRRSDPRVARRRDRVARRSFESIVYLSSLGVYGDHDGAWVDETATTIPAHARGGARLRAEQAWQALGRAARRSGRGAAARRHLRAGAERVHAAARRARAPRRQAGPRVQPHPCRRHRAGDRRRLRAQAPTASSTSPTTSPRAYSDQVLLAAKLLGIEPPQELSMEEAQQDPDAVCAELLCRLRAGEERQAQDARSA